MKKLPITVIIPTYNGQDFICRTIDSVFAQTMSPVEVILVNDGSEDDIREVIKKYPVRLINQNNGGISSARNTGILNAKNDWIALLDQDDIWCDNKLDEQWRVIEKYPNIGILFTDINLLEGNDITVKEKLKHNQTYLSVEKKNLEGDIYLLNSNSLCEQIKFGNFLTPSTMLFNRKMVKEYGYFDEEMVRGEDRELFLRWFQHVSVAIIEKPLVNYRIHSNNSSKDKLKMEYGQILVANKVINNNDKYNKSIVSYYRNQAHIIYYRYALMLLENGYSKQSRNYFKKSIKFHFNIKSFICLVLSYVEQKNMKKISRIYARLKHKYNVMLFL